MSSIHTVTLNPVIDLIYEVDIFEKGATFRADEFQFVPAGKGLNVSFSLSCLREESHAYIAVGERERVFFEEACRKRGVTGHCHPGAFPTRHHCTILERANGAVTHVQSHGGAVALNAIASLIHELLQQVMPDDIVVLSGSLPPNVPVDIYENLIRQCKEKGAKTLLDSSGEALRRGLAGQPDFLKPNQQEAEELSGIAIPNLESAGMALMKIRERAGYPQIALSLGFRGVLAALDGRLLQLFVAMREGEIRDTVGCGDALVAGLVYGLSHEFEPEAVFRYGIATATAAAMHSGPANFSWSDLEEMLHRVQVKSLG